MSQLLASLEDIQSWLPPEPVVNDDIAAPHQVEAYRIIRSQLSKKYPPVILAGWSDPAHTPDVVRDVAGELIAAFLCGDQVLYGEAIDKLKVLADDGVR